MGNKKRGKYGLKIKPQNYYPPVSEKKKKLSGTKIISLIALFIAVLVVAGTIILSQPAPTKQVPQTNIQQQSQSYPQNVAPVFYSTPALTTDNNKVSVPSNYIKSNKLVFVDLKLTTPTDTLPYQGRNVPLAYYKNGGYLPLVLISTPSGNTVTGIRTCEPCGSFSFHIVKGSNLKCDVCGTEWNLENFAPISGGCGSYPPPKLSSTTNGDNVDIDLSVLPVQVAA